MPRAQLQAWKGRMNARRDGDGMGVGGGKRSEVKRNVSRLRSFTRAARRKNFALTAFSNLLELCQ